NAAWDAHEKKIAQSVKGLTASHQKAVKEMTGHYDMYKAGAMASIKTVEEYRQDWAGKSTKKLISYEKELSNERTNLVNKLKYDVATADEIQTRIHKNR